MVTAHEEAALIDTFRIESTDPDTPFLLWTRRREAHLLEQAITNNRRQHTTATGRAGTARGQQISLRAEIADVQQQQRANGGDALEALQLSLGILKENLTTVEQASGTFKQRTAALGREPALPRGV